MVGRTDFQRGNAPNYLLLKVVEVDVNGTRLPAGQIMNGDITVEVGDTVLDENQYSVVDFAYEITINLNYLNSLPRGEHILTVTKPTSTGKEAEASITINVH